MSSAAAAARYNVRALLPGPESALRGAVEGLGLPVDRLTVLATHAAAEALVVGGLSADQTRVLESVLRERGGAVLSDADGTRALLLAPLMAMSALPAELAAWGRRTEDLGVAIGAVLMARGAPPAPWVAGDHALDVGARTLVMGVVNLTEDSFSGDGIGADPGAAADLARRHVAEGADLVDVGAESTRPNSTPVDAAEEKARLLPALRAVCAAVTVPVSVDTRKAEVAAAAIDAGATIVNDVWGLRGDPAMARVVTDHAHVGLVVMHNQAGTQYRDLLDDVSASLRESLVVAERHGIAPERIAIDPGFGFAKTPAQNLELMRRLRELRGLGRPVLLGPSRKFTIGAVLGGLPPPERTEGTLALLALAVAAGVAVVRVHDVQPAVRAVRVADAVVRGTPAAVMELPAPGPTG